MQRFQLLSGAALKYIAIISMLLDHGNKVLLSHLSPDSQLLLAVSQVLAFAGRFAFPIFFFLLVEGFFHTHSKGKYLRNLLFFALLSEIPFDLCFQGSLLEFTGQNIFFTLSLALLVIWGVDALRKRFPAGGEFGMLLIVPVGCLAAVLARVDYTYAGILVPFLFYLLRSKRLFAAIINYLVVSQDIRTLPAFLAIVLYNGQRGKQCKWLNYWIYPVHLALLAALRLLLPY